MAEVPFANETLQSQGVSSGMNSRNAEAKKFTTGDSMLMPEQMTVNQGSLIEKTTAVGDSKMQGSNIQHSQPRNRRNNEDSFMVSHAMETHLDSQQSAGISPALLESQLPQEQEVIEEEEETNQQLETGENYYQNEDDVSQTERRTTKMFKFQTKFARPFLEGQGPQDTKMTKNYNQKFTQFVQDELDFAKIDRMNHGINTVAENVETHFKDNLIRRFDQIQELKMKIAEKQMRMRQKEQAKQALVEKFHMTQESKHLVDTFNNIVESTTQNKDLTRTMNMGPKKTKTVSKENLTGGEKRKILEQFVENDQALGLLLDFISSKHLQRPGGVPDGEMMVPNSSTLFSSDPQLGAQMLNGQSLAS